MWEAGRAPIPACCGSQMVLLRSGRRAGFAIWVWRCAVCERFDSTNRRYDGDTFWVGTMGEAVRAKRMELIADAYGASGPVGST
jgi:hypothetical protein